jgi:hypothetical protein
MHYLGLQKKESIKRVKTTGFILEENTPYKTKVYNDAMKIFLESIRENDIVSIDKVESTRKSPMKK